MNDNNMREIHDKCWECLTSLQKDDPNLFFAPRQKNTNNRLKQGYRFIGTDYYMQISFWNGFDNNRRIHNISFTILERGFCYIEMHSKDNTNKASYLKRLSEILERKTGKKYSEFKNWTWQYHYPEDIHYIAALLNFIENEKPIIDEYVKAHPESGIKMLDKQFNEKYVLNRLKREENIIHSINYKKHKDPYFISRSDYIMTFEHNKLQSQLKEYLAYDKDISSIKSEDEGVDISVVRSGERIFYELKTCDVKLALRLAIGQLLEYCHYSVKKKADKLIVVTEYEPSKSDINYLNKLRSFYKLPIYYQQFKIDENILLDLY